MHFKLIIAFVNDDKTDQVIKAARENGATGATIINNARGEGITKSKSFFGLSLDTQRDVLMFLVEEHLSRHILEAIAEAGKFEAEPGTGITIQLNVEDAIGVMHQMETITPVIEDQL
ncbi:MAG: P-II family nitrogen regulator [Methylococcales bacterium]